jgi:hypothetical protein
MFTANCYNIMIVSPSDVQEERKICKDVLYHWNALNAQKSRILLNPVGYDINSHPASGENPQAAINHQILDTADIIIGIFWTKLGTPTQEYSSGSVEEITRHVDAGKQVMIYFSNVPVSPDKIDTNDYKRLKEYKKSIQNKAYYKEFNSTENFEHQLASHIQLLVNDTMTGFCDTETVPPSSTERNIADQLTDLEKGLLCKAANGDGTILITDIARGMLHIQISGDAKQTRTSREVSEIREGVQNLVLKALIGITNAKSNVYMVSARGYRVADILEGK